MLHWNGPDDIHIPSDAANARLEPENTERSKGACSAVKGASRMQGGTSVQLPSSRSAREKHTCNV